MAGRYVSNPRWEVETLRSTEGRAVLRGIANDYKDELPTQVPIKTGELATWYEETGRVRSGKLSAGLPTMQYSTGVNIYHIIEWGSVKNPPYAPLRRTAVALNLKWIGR